MRAEERPRARARESKREERLFILLPAVRIGQYVPSLWTHRLHTWGYIGSNSFSSTSSSSGRDSGSGDEEGAGEKVADGGCLWTAHYVPHYARTQGALSARARPGNLAWHSSRRLFFPSPPHLRRSRILPASPSPSLPPLPRRPLFIPVAGHVSLHLPPSYPIKNALNVNTSLWLYPEL